MNDAFFRKIHSFSLRMHTQRGFRHAIFFLAALIVVTLYGYYFGTFDQASHIPFLKKTLDPSLFPSDHFFDLRTTHYSYFWLFFLPLLKAGILEYVMFGVHMVSTYLTFWALWRLSITLFRNPTIATVTVIAFIFPHVGFSGFPLFEFSMLNRTVCLAFELFAMSWYLQKKYTRTFLTLGLLYNLHALSVHFFAAMLFFDLLTRIRRDGVGRIVRSAITFLIGAVPVLVWKFGHSGVSFMPQREWFDILNRAVFYHLFNFLSAHNPFVILLTLSGFGSIVLFFIVSRMYSHSELHQSVKNWFIAGMIVCFAQFVATVFFPATILIQSQILRIGVIMSTLTYLYVSAYVVSLAEKDKTTFPYFFTSLLLSPSPILFLVTWIGHIKKITLITRFWNAVVLSCFCIVLVIIYILNLWSPGFFIFPQKTPFVRAQLWAKNNTPKDTIFITPPDIWWMYETEWRVVSERSTVSTLSELLEAAFDPAYISYWKPRFEDVAPGAIQQFDGNFFENRRITYQAFYRNSAAQFTRLSKKYGARYLVTDRKHKYPFPIAYMNEGYVVYTIR
jgi:hypothetical protein